MTKRRRILLVFLIAGDVFFVFFSLNLAYFIRAYIGRSPDNSLFALAARHPLLMSFFIIIYLFSFYVFDLYNIKNPSFNRLFKYSYPGAILFSTFLIFIQFWFFPYRFGRGVFLFNLVILTALFLPWRIFVFRWVLRMISPQKVLVIGTHKEEIVLRSLVGMIPGYRICGSIPIGRDGRTNRPRHIRRKIESVLVGWTPDLIIISLNIRPERGWSEVFLWIRVKGIPVVDFPTFLENLTNKIPLSHINEDWLMLGAIFCKPRSVRYEKVKRVFDLIVASFSLALSLPLFVIIAALVKSTSKGPVFFIQERLGKNKKPFALWKFRSMVVKAEKGVPRWASPDDARVTMVGRLLRKIRLDELPQLVNILRGDMSIVGPRPERQYFVRRLEAKIPFYSFRFMVKPGITGWAQINYQYGACIKDARQKLMYELYYIKNQSLWLDLKIMAKTLKVIMFRAGR